MLLLIRDACGRGVGNIIVLSVIGYCCCWLLLLAIAVSDYCCCLVVVGWCLLLLIGVVNIAVGDVVVG